MQSFMFVMMLGMAASARLDNQYLPPISQKSFSNGASGAFAIAGASAQAYSSNSLNQVPILKLATENEGDGTYRYNYETGNSITAEEQGDARGDGTKAHGSYSFTLPNGEHVSVSYTADENGFVPEGSHIPTAPPVPEAILKALQENAAAEARGIFDDGSYHGEGESEGQYKGEGENAGGFGRSVGGAGSFGGSSGSAGAFGGSSAGAGSFGGSNAGAGAFAGGNGGAQGYASNGGYRY